MINVTIDRLTDSLHHPGMMVGDCRLIERHALGGTCDVWRADRNGRLVAVKLLRFHTSSDSRVRALLQREISLLAHLSGLSHIVQFIGDNGIDEPVALIMEFVHGPSLDQLLHQSLSNCHRALQWDQLKPLLLQACLSMHSLHEAGVFQADYKPGNLLVDPAGKLLITDFGIANVQGDQWQHAGIKPISHYLKPSELFGTIAYVAPEQSWGVLPGVLTDIYCFVTCIYTLLCGHPPFTGENLAVMYRKHTEDAPLLEADNLPVGLREVVAHGLDRAPNVRPTSALDLHAALVQLLKEGITVG